MKCFTGVCVCVSSSLGMEVVGVAVSKATYPAVMQLDSNVDTVAGSGLQGAADCSLPSEVAHVASARWCRQDNATQQQ